MSETNQDRKRTALFFAGTDTDVGKTFTASLIAQWFHQHGPGPVGVYKPVASGCRRDGSQLVADDAVKLWQAAGCPRTLHEVCPQRFKAPLAPTQAARLEGKSVDLGLLRSGAQCWESESEPLIIEGAGGLMSPLADGVLNIDLAKQFDGIKLIVVAANRLGVIHQTLATCAAAKLAGLPPAGVILCQVEREADQSTERNADEIRRYTDVPLLGSVGYGAVSDDVAFAGKLL
tara:strand:+ start:35557 stop:36252 length:696 start_codon:yes stop_codon:yes gene_type:complete